MLALDREEFGLIAASPIFFPCLLRAFYMCVTGNKSIPAMLVVATSYQPFFNNQLRLNGMDISVSIHPP